MEMSQLMIEVCKTLYNVLVKIHGQTVLEMVESIQKITNVPARVAPGRRGSGRRPTNSVILQHGQLLRRITNIRSLHSTVQSTHANPTGAIGRILYDS